MAFYPALRDHVEQETLKAARAAVSKTRRSLAQARAKDAGEKGATTGGDGVSSGDGVSGEAQADSPAVRRAELALAKAETSLASIQARWAADRAKYAAPAASDQELTVLAERAAKAERDHAWRSATLAVFDKQQSLTTAHRAAKKSAKATKSDTGPTKEPTKGGAKNTKPNAAAAKKLKEAAAAKKLKEEVAKAEKELAAARKTLETAKAALAKTDAKYTPVGKEYPRTSTGRRLALARWITSRQNPLTARVAVNHIWLRHFGAPLVDNVFDFGLRSPRPRHAALLDTLAVELMESDWSMKGLHRLIATSNTYRLSSSAGDAPQANQEIDADNHYLWRMNARRLDAELVRDGILHVAGSLDLSAGGAEIDYRQGENVPRRSVYFQHAYEKQMNFLVLFDAASVNECYRRSESIIPQQALAMSNSSLSLTQSRRLARRLDKETSAAKAPDAAFVRAAFEQVLSRPATKEEIAACREFLDDQAARLADPSKLTPFTGGAKPKLAPSGDPRLRARENLVHVLLNHNDFVTVR